MKNYSRLDEADQAIEEALIAISRASSLLGFSEGKEIVQFAGNVVAESRRRLQQFGVTRPGVTSHRAVAVWASSPSDERAWADLDLVDEPQR